MPGTVSTLQQAGKADAAADIEARIKVLRPDFQFERSKDESKETPKDTEVETVEEVANIPSDA